MSLSMYRPMRLTEMLDRMFDDSGFGRSAEGYGMPVDVYATEDDYIIRAVVPGLKPEDVKVEITDNTVTISGEVLPPEKTNGDKTGVLLHEIRYGIFSRSIALGSDLASDKTEAQVENGVLTLRVPKAEAAKPKVIRVKAK